VDEVLVCIFFEYFEKLFIFFGTIVPFLFVLKSFSLVASLYIGKMCMKEYLSMV